MKGMRNEFWEEEFEDYIFIIFLIYKLDEEKAASAAVSKAAGDAGAVSPAAPIAEEETDQPKIIKEEISGGHIEKLVAPDGKVIAEKTIKDGEVVKKVLNYYHPNGQVSRKVTTLDDGKGFYAEDYYMNGRLAAQATYLNENNKIGTEKKYDNNGTLRPSGSAIGVEQLTFLYGDVADRRHVRLEWNCDHA